MTTSYMEIRSIEFELANTLTWGVTENRKYGGYSIPIVLDTETANKVREIVGVYGTKDPVYGRTIYLKSKELTEKQTRDLLNKGRCHVEVHFVIRGIYTDEDDVSYLVTKVIKLRIAENLRESQNQRPRLLS